MKSVRYGMYERLPGCNSASSSCSVSGGKRDPCGRAGEAEAGCWRATCRDVAHAAAATEATTRSWPLAVHKQFWISRCRSTAPQHQIIRCACQICVQISDVYVERCTVRAYQTCMWMSACRYQLCTSDDHQMCISLLRSRYRK